MCNQRNGFTLVELLVVIVIIAILASVMLPAVNMVRETANRLVCQSNMKQVALAVVNYEAVKKCYPPCGEVEKPDNGTTFDPQSGKMFSWIVKILPELGETTIAEKFDYYKPVTEQDDEPQAIPIDILCCPSDDANGLMYNSSEAENKDFAKGNIVAYNSPFHVDLTVGYPGALTAFDKKNRRQKQIVDGITRTLLLSEVKTRDHEQDQRGAWALPWTGASLLAYDMHARKKKPYEGSSISEGYTQLPNNEGAIVDMLYECPEPADAQLKNMPCEVYVQGTRTAYLSAAPRSNHTGGVNVAYMDGRVDFLHDDIDLYVMVYLISTNDVKSKRLDELDD